MYPNYIPKLRVEKTISHPLHTERVIGFVARNKMLGSEAIVIKEDWISEGTISMEAIVPQEEAKRIENGSEIHAIWNGTVYSMTGTDFKKHSFNRTHKLGDEFATMKHLSLSHDQVRKFKKENVPINNS